MQVREIDIHDDDLVRRWWDVGRIGDEYGRSHSVYWSLAAATGSLRSPGSADHHPLACWDGDEIVGMSEVVLPVLDNRHVAYVDTIVLPGRRREGIGTALLEAALAVAHEAGRTTFIIEVFLPYGRSGEETSPGSHFLTRHGFSAASKEVHRVLELPADPQVLEVLERDAIGHASGYQIVGFDDRVPDEYMDGYCALQIAFNDEAPTGDLDIEAEYWDEDRVRKSEERLERQGRQQRRTIALDPSGRVVALTEMFASHHQPESGFQGGTLVLPGHRGRRLGMATKLANLRRYAADFPGVRQVHSWNAEINGPMVAINEAIGFRPVEYLVEMQRRDQA